MHTALRNRTWTLMLLSSVLCSEWKVKYERKNICAVKGSTVVIHCSFFYPNKLSIQSVKWARERSNAYVGPFIFDSESNKNNSRYQYIGDSDRNCSFKIHQVERNDTGTHFFRFITSSKEGSTQAWTGIGGSSLQVVNLNVLMTKTNSNGTMKEGDSVTLTCTNRCDRPGLSSAFTWFKNGEPIDTGPVLYLSNISSTNSGNYTCSLKAQKGTTSGAISINVEYGPKNTSVFVRPSTELDAGNNITLTCSTNANPTVEHYTWFKMGHDDVAVGNGPELNFREIHSHDSGQYFCSVTNKHGHQNSSIVTLKVKAYWRPFPRVALIIATVSVLLIVTTVIATIRLNKIRSTPNTSQETEDIENTIYVNWPGRSQEENRCEGATPEPIYATVEFSAKTKSKMQQQMDSRNDDDEEVIYSTVCRDHRS